MTYQPQYRVIGAKKEKWVNIGAPCDDRVTAMEVVSDAGARMPGSVTFQIKECKAKT